MAPPGSGYDERMAVFMVWFEEPSATTAVVAEPGPWREAVEAAPGLLFVESEDTLSRVYHAVKWRLPDDCPLAVAPVGARPKARGLTDGTVSWLRARVDMTA